MSQQHRNFKSILGQRFGQLVVTQEIDSTFCIALCDCGQSGRFYRSNLRAGYTSKCHSTPVNFERQRTLYVWFAMKARCLNPNHPQHSTYDRPSGHIQVCERWLLFENFLADMGYAPEGMELDRVDNDGNYEPSNCRWATREQQMRNTRANHRLTFQGKTQTVTEWAVELGLNKSTLYKRLGRSGWSIERALSTI
jgi:hypothetical protein